jgi:lysophospholipase L1-like esterase
MGVSLPPLTRARLGLVALVGVLAAALAGAPAAHAEANYAGLGDSFTAGPLIPNQIPPLGCLKSDNNYPHLLARDDGFGLTLRDASCSGAETEDMWSSQNVSPDPDPPPQFSVLDADTQLVTVGIGGNDIGFSEIIENCTSRTSPEGQPCQDHYVRGGNDVISKRIKKTAPKIDAVLEEIHARSPQADVYVVNYLPILPHAETDRGRPGCWPQVPVAYDDVGYLRAKHEELNAMLAEQAAQNAATIVDAYTKGKGWDACQKPGERWVEPEVPVAAAAPYHPNADGMRGTADAVRATVP